MNKTKVSTCTLFCYHFVSNILNDMYIRHTLTNKHTHKKRKVVYPKKSENSEYTRRPKSYSALLFKKWKIFLLWSCHLEGFCGLMIYHVDEDIQLADKSSRTIDHLWYKIGVLHLIKKWPKCIAILIFWYLLINIDQIFIKTQFLSLQAKGLQNCRPSKFAPAGNRTRVARRAAIYYIKSRKM